MKWLQPALKDKLKEIENRKVIIYPISFTIDNMETIYELKIEYKEIAKKIGYTDYKVVECLNNNDKFIDGLVNLINDN